jgi:hypothetical protein
VVEVAELSFLLHQASVEVVEGHPSFQLHLAWVVEEEELLFCQLLLYQEEVAAVVVQLSCFQEALEVEVGELLSYSHQAVMEAQVVVPPSLHPEAMVVQGVVLPFCLLLLRSAEAVVLEEAVLSPLQEQQTALYYHLLEHHYYPFQQLQHVSISLHVQPPTPLNQVACTRLLPYQKQPALQML